VLDRLAVTNLAAAPTVYRALRNNVQGTGGDVRLRCLSSAGGALCPQT
jgi:acetyl-CoA synthetase